MSAPLNTVPLSRAVLCAGCDTISDATSDQCPSCTSHSLMSLAVLLGTNEIIPEPAAMVQRLSQRLAV